MTRTAIYLDAELAPSRSLSQQGQRLVIWALGASALCMSVVFLSYGLFPIVGFLGLDILVIWACFRHSRKKQDQRTFIRVTADNIDLRHVDGKGRERTAKLPSGFAKIELEDSNRGGGIRISSGGQAYRIGRFLTLDERRDFINYMRAALQRARAERYPNE